MGFGASDVTKPYEFIWFGDRWVRGLFVCGGFVGCLCAVGSWSVCVRWARGLFASLGFVGCLWVVGSWVHRFIMLRGLFACGGFVGCLRAVASWVRRGGGGFLHRFLHRFTASSEI